MTTYVTAEIFTDMIGEFPTEIEEIGAEIIRAAYRAYRPGLGNYWQAAGESVTVESDDLWNPCTFYARFRDDRYGNEEYAYVTVVTEDGTEQNYRVRFVSNVDRRHPEYASVEEW